MRRLPIVLAIGLLAVLSTGSLPADKPTVTVTGILKAAETYRGKVVSVSITDAREGEFLVARSTEIGQQLLGHVGTRVRATGYVKKPRPGSDFVRVIDVINYEIDPPKVAAMTGEQSVDRP